MTRPALSAAVLTGVLVAWVPSASPQALSTCEANDGSPFGETTEAHLTALGSLARRQGLDLEAVLGRAYAGDESSLESIFRLSMQFRTLDAAARAYGNMLYSMLLKVGEMRGLERFTTLLLRQDAATLQRVRDFLYYPAICLASSVDRAIAEKAARERSPRLWPKQYVFGERDSLFR
jgi:hypothetical protein